MTQKIVSTTICLAASIALTGPLAPPAQSLSEWMSDADFKLFQTYALQAKKLAASNNYAEALQLYKKEYALLPDTDQRKLVTVEEIVESNERIYLEKRQKNQGTQSADDKRIELAEKLEWTKRRAILTEKFSGANQAAGLWLNVSCLESAIHLYEDAFTHAKKAIEAIDDSNFFALLCRRPYALSFTTSSLAAIGHVKQSEQLLTMVQAKAKILFSAPSRELALSTAHLFDFYLLQKRYKDAQTAFTAILAIPPRKPTADDSTRESAVPVMLESLSSLRNDQTKEKIAVKFLNQLLISEIKNYGSDDMRVEAIYRILAGYEERAGETIAAKLSRQKVKQIQALYRDETPDYSTLPIDAKFKGFSSIPFHILNTEELSDYFKKNVGARPFSSDISNCIHFLLPKYVDEGNWAGAVILARQAIAIQDHTSYISGECYNGPSAAKKRVRYRQILIRALTNLKQIDLAAAESKKLADETPIERQPAPIPTASGSRDLQSASTVSEFVPVATSTAKYCFDYAVLASDNLTLTDGARVWRYEGPGDYMSYSFGGCFGTLETSQQINKAGKLSFIYHGEPHTLGPLASLALERNGPDDLIVGLNAFTAPPVVPPLPLADSLPTPSDAKLIKISDADGFGGFTLIPGDYYATDIEISSGIRLPEFGRVRIFLQDENHKTDKAFFAKVNGQLNCMQLRPSPKGSDYDSYKLEIWYNGTRPLVFNGAQLNCLIYAPHATVELGPGGVTTHGSIVAKNVIAKGQVNITHEHGMAKWTPDKPD